MERLGEQHHLGAFTCGVKSLDDWLRDHALDNQRRDLSRTFVLLDDGDRVIGYYALTMGGVRREALPARYGRGLPRYEIGMVLLARFAIADDHQGQGLGRDLLIEAIERPRTPSARIRPERAVAGIEVRTPAIGAPADIRCSDRPTVPRATGPPVSFDRRPGSHRVRRACPGSPCRTPDPIRR